MSIDLDDLGHIEICQKCMHLYMPRFERNKWLESKPMEALNTEFCEVCKPLYKEEQK